MLDARPLVIDSAAYLYPGCRLDASRGAAVDRGGSLVVSVARPGLSGRLVVDVINRHGQTRPINFRPSSTVRFLPPMHRFLVVNELGAVIETWHDGLTADNRADDLGCYVIDNDSAEVL